MSRNGEPRTDFERALHLADTDCSRFACWNPAVFFIRNPHPQSARYGEPLQVCADHVDGHEIIGTTGD